MTADDLKSVAAAIAAELKSGSVTPELRARFIAVRAALFQRGIYDPVLVRFDSYTAPPATPQEVGEQLELVSAAL